MIITNYFIIKKYKGTAVKKDFYIFKKVYNIIYNKSIKIISSLAINNF